MCEFVRCDDVAAMTHDPLRMRAVIDVDEGHVRWCPLLLIYFYLGFIEVFRQFSVCRN